MPTLEFERQFLTHDCCVIAGTDEAGRGPLAGPVVAAACILPPDFLPEGLDDSKKLTEKKREKFSLRLPEIRFISRSCSKNRDLQMASIH